MRDFVRGWSVVLGLVMAASAHAQAPSKPNLVVTERLRDLGHVIEGDKREIRWKLENQGDGELVIGRVIPTCGCTVVTLSEDERHVPPGGKLELKAEFNSAGRPGTQRKGVTVHSNDPNQPILGLEFTAEVQRLLIVTPASVANLRAVSRGQPCEPPIEFLPGPGHAKVEIVGMVFAEDNDGALRAAAEPFETREGATAQRVVLTANDDVALGPISTHLTVKTTVDGIPREQIVPIVGEVVGDLTWLPRVVDHTRVASRRGNRLTPVTIRANDRTPFTVTGTAVTNPEILDLQVESNLGGGPSTRFVALPTIKDDAPVGPFGTELIITTDSPDQPVIKIPVFGTVASQVDFDPPVVLLKPDGTPSGTERRIRVQAAPLTKLEVWDPSCDNAAVTVEIEPLPLGRTNHVRFLKVRLVGDPGSSPQKATLSLRTSVTADERLTLPVMIEASGK